MLSIQDLRPYYDLLLSNFNTYHNKTFFENQVIITKFKLTNMKKITIRSTLNTSYSYFPIY